MMIKTNFTFKIWFYHFYNFRGNKKKSNKCKGLEDIDDVVSYKLPKCIELFQIFNKKLLLCKFKSVNFLIKTYKDKTSKNVTCAFSIYRSYID